MAEDKRQKCSAGYQPIEKGYQAKGNIDMSNPPKVGTGVPPKSKEEK